jgi:dihydrofolate reductase
MGKVKSDITMSLDGFIAGPNDSAKAGLGEGGERLHRWMYELATFHERHGREGGETGTDDQLLAEAFENVGAYVMGRRMFDLGEGPWGDDPPFHGPVFVVTHQGRQELPKEGGTTFTFVSDGLESALDQARAAAGDGDVSIAGGANVIQQCLTGGLLDEIQVHVTPVLLGEGRRLFEDLGSEQIELEPTRVIESPEVTHLKYRVAR